MKSTRNKTRRYEYSNSLARCTDDGQVEKARRCAVNEDSDEHEKMASKERILCVIRAFSRLFSVAFRVQ